MATAWPDLPLPSLEGYSFKPAAAVDRRALDIGAARVYRRTRKPMIEVPVVWQFSADEQARFDRFQVGTLQSGQAWFTMPLALPAGLVPADCRFKGGVQMAALGRERWRTTATLELLDRPVMSAAELTAALGDGGAAAWPEGKLPCPHLDGWQVQTQPATIRTDDLPGLAQQRLRSRNSVDAAPAAWELSAEEAALFDAFLRWRACDGARWISFPLIQAQGKRATDVRFTGEVSWLLRERSRWGVSAPIEIRERPLV